MESDFLPLPLPRSSLALLLSPHIRDKVVAAARNDGATVGDWLIAAVLVGLGHRTQLRKRLQFLNVPPRPCIWCGKLFDMLGKRPDQSYCSKRCGNARANASRLT